MNANEQAKVDALSSRLKTIYLQGYDAARSGSIGNVRRPERKDELEAFNLGMYHGTLSVQEECAQKRH